MFGSSAWQHEFSFMPPMPPSYYFMCVCVCVCITYIVGTMICLCIYFVGTHITKVPIMTIIKCYWGGFWQATQRFSSLCLVNVFIHSHCRDPHILWRPASGICMFAKITVADIRKNQGNLERIGSWISDRGRQKRILTFNRQLSIRPADNDFYQLTL